MAAMKCPSGLKLVNGKCVDASGKSVSAPYVSESGGFYPDDKSLTSGCAKNPNGPGCKSALDKLSPSQRAKVKGIQQLGGRTKMKKYQNGGNTIQNLPEVTIKATKAKSSPGSMWTKMFKGKKKPGMDKPKEMYQTGGMVNSNAKLQASKVAGSKGVKSGVNPKAAASKVAKSRVGGTSVAPKTALPKAQMGGISSGRPISENAAKRKTEKGKGYISYRIPSTEDDKGKFIPYTRAGRKEAKSTGMISSSNMKPGRMIQQKGGVIRKGKK